MTTNTTNAPKAKKNVKTPAEQIAEFGSVSLGKLCEACIPSDESLAAIEKLSAECKELENAISSLPEVAVPYAKQALDGKLYKLAMLRANIGNPANLSERDRLALTIAAKRLLKHGKANILTVAQFVKDNVQVFPVKGTKY